MSRFGQRPRREAPPLSKQPFIFYCLVALVFHVLLLGGLFFFLKERSRPVIDEALVYGTTKVDMTKVHWMNTQPSDLVASALGRSSESAPPDSSPPMESEPESEPEPEPEPEPTSSIASIGEPEPELETVPAIRPDPITMTPERIEVPDDPPAVAAVPLGSSTRETGIGPPPETERDSSTSSIGGGVPVPSTPSPERNMNPYGATASTPVEPSPSMETGGFSPDNSANNAILAPPTRPQILDSSPTNPDAIAPSPSSIMREYEINLLAKFEEGWRTPHLDIALQVRAEVIVGQDGRIVRSRIVQASNHFEMDQSVRRALDQVIRAAPLPSVIDSPTYKFILTFAIP